MLEADKTVKLRQKVENIVDELDIMLQITSQQITVVEQLEELNEREGYGLGHGLGDHETELEELRYKAKAVLKKVSPQGQWHAEYLFSNSLAQLDHSLEREVPVATDNRMFDIQKSLLEQQQRILRLLRLLAIATVVLVRQPTNCDSFSFPTETNEFKLPLIFMTNFFGMLGTDFPSGLTTQTYTVTFVCKFETGRCQTPSLDSMEYGVANDVLQFWLPL